MTIPARDGYPLEGSAHEPKGGRGPSGVVVVGSAMAVRRSYYHAFASHLASLGQAVVLFDYRGMGGSRPRRLGGFQATLADWGERDLAGVLDWAAARYGGSPLHLVAHSIGGVVAGLAPNNGRIRSLLLVAAQAGEWRLWPRPRRWFMPILWYGAVPALVRAFGYLPGRLGMGEDLPAGVALEWARWCRRRENLIGGPGAPRRRTFEQVEAPLLAYSFSDDTYAPPRAVESLLDLYARARRTHRHLHPSDLGVRSIGHFGFFRTRYRETLWDEAARWLLAPASSSKP